MFGTSQNRLTCEFLVRMGSGGEPEGQGASESIFSEKTLDLDIQIPSNTYWEGVWAPKHACKRELFVKRLLTRYDWRIFNDEG